MSDITKDWQLYEDGVKYNQSLKPNYYDTVDTNLAFSAGDQWRNVQANGMPTPTFNIISRAKKYFVASIMSSKVGIKLEPLTNNEKETGAQGDSYTAKIAQSEIENLFEKFKMDNRIRDALGDAFDIGDVAAHMWFDKSKKPYRGAFGDVKGEICFELVDGTSIVCGNANNPIIDKYIQPYVILHGRDMVKTLQAEAENYAKKGSKAEDIMPDSDYQHQASDMGKIEIESEGHGKASYIIIYKYNREKDTITVSKCTKSAYMYEDVETGLDNYPVTLLHWEKQKNQYHGRAMCTGIIPNQIFINKMFAMVMYHLMMAAFPKAVYDSDKIETWNNEVGQAIPLTGLMPGDNIKNLAGYLEPGNMSNQITQAIELALKYTKETLGINDAALGDVNPEQASGVSIATTVRQASIPLENVKANLYEWIEDIGRILTDIMGTNYGERPIVVSEKGVKQIVKFDFSVLKNLWINTKCDVGPSTYWSEIAMVQMLDNLLNRNDPLFTLIDYLESLPEAYKNQDLIDRLKVKAQQMQQAQLQAQQQQQTADDETMAQQGEAEQQQLEQVKAFVDTLPEEAQAEIASMGEHGLEFAMKLMEMHKGERAKTIIQMVHPAKIK